MPVIHVCLAEFLSCHQSAEPTVGISEAALIYSHRELGSQCLKCTRLGMNVVLYLNSKGVPHHFFLSYLTVRKLETLHMKKNNVTLILSN